MGLCGSHSHSWYDSGVLLHPKPRTPYSMTNTIIALPKSRLIDTKNKSQCSRRRRSARPPPAVPLRRTPATQQTQYLGESAETPEATANSLELPVPATVLWAATPPAISISGHDPHTSRYPAPPTQHPAHPSAQPARSGVRSEHPHPAERTRKLQVHMGLVASATARIASNNRRVLPRPPFSAHFAA